MQLSVQGFSKRLWKKAAFVYFWGVKEKRKSRISAWSGQRVNVNFWEKKNLNQYWVSTLVGVPVKNVLCLEDVLIKC